MKMLTGVLVKGEDDPKSILIEDIDKEVLSRMPLWFRRLRAAYLKSKD